MGEAEIDPRTLRALLDAFDASDWDELSLTLPGGDSLHLSRDADGALPAAATAASPSPVAAAAPAPPVAAAVPVAAAAPAAGAPAPAPAEAPAAPPADAPGVPVASTTVGIFWVAPAPGEPPFVEVGTRVTSGDTIGILEVMKLMNHVPTDTDGVVTAVLVGNGEAVEFGQPLVVVDPEG